MSFNEKIECQKCWWVGTYNDLIAPTSDHEPSCPECLSDDFLEIEDVKQTVRCYVCDQGVDPKKANGINNNHNHRYYCKKVECQKMFNEDAGDPPDYEE